MNRPNRSAAWTAVLAVAMISMTSSGVVTSAGADVAKLLAGALK
jgi:hypothetical protein